MDVMKQTWNEMYGCVCRIFGDWIGVLWKHTDPGRQEHRNGLPLMGIH